MIITKTFKFNKKAIWLIVADFVFLLAILGALFIAGIFEKKTSGQLEMVGYYGEQIDDFLASGKGIEETEEISDELEKGTDTIKNFFLTLLIGVGLVLIFLITVSTFVKGYIYSKLLNIPYKKFIRHFSIINISWQLSWLGIFVLVLLLIAQWLIPFFLLAWIILYLVLTPIIRSCVKGNFFKNFGKCIKRIYLFIPPILLMILAGFVVFLFVGGTGFIHGLVMLVFSVLFIVLISWSRYYYFMVVKKCVKLK